MVMETRLDRTGVDAASGDLHSRSVCRDTLAIFGLPYVESNVMEHRMRANLRWEFFPDRRFGGAMQGGSSSRLVPARLSLWMQPFREGFTAPTWAHVLLLVVGAILTPGRRTVAAALRVVGLEQAVDFTNYHRVLNRNRWSSRWVARCLFRVPVNNLVPTGPVVMGLDDTIERRWGAKIKARGIIGTRPALRMDISSRQWSAMAVGHAAARDSPGRGASGHCHS